MKFIPYIQKLKDPRWQKKRLEIMERDDFTCRRCGDAKTTLNVHHRRYERGRDPWEYDEKDLITFCEPCHEEATRVNRHLEVVVERIHACVMTTELAQVVAGFAEALMTTSCESSDPIVVDSPYKLMGIALATGSGVAKTHAEIVDGKITEDRLIKLNRILDAFAELRQVLGGSA